MLQILDKGRVGQKYNIGGNNEITNKNLIQSICEKLDNKLPKIKSYKEQIVYVQDRPGHDMRYAINNQKVVSEIGWEPTISFEKGLDQTIEWYLNNSDWWQPLFNKQQEFSRPGILQ